MGICRLPGDKHLYRRIDLKSYRRTQVRTGQPINSNYSQLHFSYLVN